MAQIKHNTIKETMVDLLNQAENYGVIQLKSTNENWDGKNMEVNHESKLNFGTCGYLGLEKHPAILSGAQEYMFKFGMQFSVSRTYIQSTYSITLEETLSKLYDGLPVLTSSSTTLMHAAIIPYLIDKDDVILLDQQCHASMQSSVLQTLSSGTKLDIIRHSDMQMLEDKLKIYASKYTKVWYFADGVYSMFGDVLPINQLNHLLSKYENFNLYVDDAHGMSWAGTNGRGLTFDQCKPNQKTIYVTTMAKGFGVMGGVAVFPSKSLYRKVKQYGGPLTHSHPLPPVIVGACLASAKIHLSNEIVTLQKTLQQKIELMNTLLNHSNLPVISNPITPIFFIACGDPAFGYSLNKKMLDSGYYTNVAMFPAVPLKNTGLRFTITNHLSESEIIQFANDLEINYSKTCFELGTSIEVVHKLFKRKIEIIDSVKGNQNERNYQITLENTLEKINKEEWNACFASKGNFDYDSLAMYQSVFSGHEQMEHNYKFYFLIIKDENNRVVLATFFTISLAKDDMFHEVKVSKIVEKMRQNEPYLYCSKVLMLGSQISEGDHLYINNQSPQLWDSLFQIIEDIQKIEKPDQVWLRDFAENEKLNKLMHERGYLKINLPNANVIQLSQHKSLDFMQTISKRNRKSIQQEVIRYKEMFEFQKRQSLQADELNFLYTQFKKMTKSNLHINMFAYPEKLFIEVNKDPHYFFYVMTEKSTSKVYAVILCHQGKKIVTPLLVGYEKWNEKVNPYKISLYEMIQNERLGENEKINLGFSADIEKKKVGATQLAKVAYIYVEDQFVMDYLNTLSYNATIV